MRKTIAAILILFVFSLTMSCSSNPKVTITTDSQITTITSSKSASSETAAATTATATLETSATSAETTNAVPTTAPTTAPAPKTDPDLNSLLDKITYLEEGTAGASLKQASAAGRILDWVESTKLSQSEVEAQISSYLMSSSDSEAAALLTANFKTVSATAQLIIGGDASTLSSLNDSGYVLTHSKYTQAKWDNFAKAIQTATNAL